MLDAYVRKGAELPTEPRPTGGRRVIEDAITSTLLTPVRFMAPAEMAQLVSLLIGSELELPATCKLTMWPELPAVSFDAKAHFVEPDVVIDFGYQNRTTRIVLEIKWDDVLHFSQVKAQLAAATVDLKPRDSICHACIVKFADLEVFRSQETTVRQWAGVLNDLERVVSWGDQTSMSEIAVSWCRDAALFLRRLGIGSFVGFGKLPLVPVGNEFSAAALLQFAWADLRPLPTHVANRSFGEGFVCL